MDFDQINNKFVQEQYQKDNFLIEYDAVESKTATVYFTSNSLYFPNTEETFLKTVVEKDRYEWRRNKTKNTQKHIFIRDLFKQWYLKGINSEINSVEKLASFIKKEIEGYQTTFIGSSAGGFIATLLSTMMEVEKVITFNNQFDLTISCLTEENREKNPIVYKHRNDDQINQYYQLQNHLQKGNSNVFYFLSLKSDIDTEQYEVVKSNNQVNCFQIDSGIHGIPLDFSSLSILLNASKQQYLKMVTNKSVNNLYFYWKGLSFFGFIKVLLKRLKLKLTR